MYSVSGGNLRHMMTLKQLQELGGGEGKGAGGKGEVGRGLLQCSKSPTDESSSCELSKMRMCIPSTSGVSETVACPPPPVSDRPSAMLSPTSSPLRSVTLPVCSLDASPCKPAVVLYYWTFKVLCCKIKNVSFVFHACLIFVYYLCEKYYLYYSTI